MRAYRLFDKSDGSAFDENIISEFLSLVKHNLKRHTQDGVKILQGKFIPSETKAILDVEVEQEENLYLEHKYTLYIKNFYDKALKDYSSVNSKYIYQIPYTDEVRDALAKKTARLIVESGEEWCFKQYNPFAFDPDSFEGIFKLDVERLTEAIGKFDTSLKDMSREMSKPLSTAKLTPYIRTTDHDDVSPDIESEVDDD